MYNNNKNYNNKVYEYRNLCEKVCFIVWLGDWIILFYVVKDEDVLSIFISFGFVYYNWFWVICRNGFILFG